MPISSREFKQTPQEIRRAEQRAAARQLMREVRANAALSRAPNETGDHVGAFGMGCLIPAVGLIMGLIRAFSPEPRQKQDAGYWLGGAVLGMVLVSVVVWLMLLMGEFGH